MAAAADALGREPRRVFLTIGRLQIEAFSAAPQHFYLIRTIEPLAPLPNLPRRRVVHGRGPFVVEAEEKLLREESIDIIVTKNSGARRRSQNFSRRGVSGCQSSWSPAHGKPRDRSCTIRPKPWLSFLVIAHP